MSNLDALLPYVINGTAEGDRGFLDKVFITPNHFDRLIGIEPGGVRLLVGNKGMGKSAIIERLLEVGQKKKMPCLLIRPEKIVAANSLQPISNDVATLKAYYLAALSRAIGGEIGSKLKGLTTGANSSLYSEARRQGLADADVVQKTINLLTAISVPAAKFNAAALAKELTGPVAVPELIRAIGQNLLAKGSVFFLLLDDTDQIADPNIPGQLNRIWALILAVRSLVGDCPNVRAIITLRTEVWSRLKNEDKSQRDQTDHVRGLVIPLRAPDTLIEGIIRKRLQEAASQVGQRGFDPYKLFFHDDHIFLPGSDERRTWDSFIVKSARERPRDAIQLIKNMIDEARRNNNSRIGSVEAAAAMRTYSRERVEDLEKEFGNDCSNIKYIIESFSSVDFESSLSKIIDHLEGIPSSYSTSIRGKLLSSNNEDDALILLKFLHETGFLNPRVVDSRQSRGFRHILFPDQPDFIRENNWNDMEAATWEIHPAFRTHLLDTKQSIIAKAMRKQKRQS